MAPFRITDEKSIRQAAELAVLNIERLRETLPFLPERRTEDLQGRIEWMVREGRVYGIEQAGRLEAFLGWFTLDDYRNLGRGALTPDWCSAVRDESRTTALIAPLVRRMLTDIVAEGLGVHAIGITASSTALLEEFSLLGWGRIVADASHSAEELHTRLSALCESEAEKDSGGLAIRKASASDAEALCAIDAKLALHIGQPPILMNGAHGSTIEEWRQWLSRNDQITFIAEIDGVLAGFIRADPPHLDVSYLVHGDDTLAVCGLFVEPAFRGRKLGARLLGALVTAAIKASCSRISVDFETMNPEARVFWLKWFKPVSWSLERRL